MNLPLVLQAITTFSIFGGLIFALIQLRITNQQRSRETALQMLHSFRTPEFLNAVDIVFDLPMGLTKKEIEERVGDRITSILVLFGTLESLGILVHKRDVDIEMVEDFFSGVIVLSGKKLNNYLAEMRKKGNRETYYEWYQWLYEQVEKREAKKPAVPAFIAYRDWEP